MRIFAQQGWHVAPMGVKFGTEERTEGPLLRAFGAIFFRANFHPHWCNDKGIGPPKLKFVQIFDQNVEYKRPAVAYSLRDFRKICRICTSFQVALAVKVSLDLLKGLWSYGVLIWRGLVNPKFSMPLAAKLCVRPQTLQERARGTLLPCQVWWGSDFTCRWGGEKRWVFCLSVTLFLSVTFLNIIDCAPDFIRKRWSTEMILMPLDRGRFAVVHPCSTFSGCRQLSTSLNAEVQKTAKMRYFAARGRYNKPIKTNFDT